MAKPSQPRGFKQMLAEANSVIESVSVQDLPYLLDDDDVLLIDVRETAELDSTGAIPGAIHIPRGLLEFKVDRESPVYHSAVRPERKIIVYCGTGGRSALAAKTLMEMGFEDVASLTGGYDAWQLTQSD